MLSMDPLNVPTEVYARRDGEWRTNQTQNALNRACVRPRRTFDRGKKPPPPFLRWGDEFGHKR